MKCTELLTECRHSFRVSFANTLLYNGSGYFSGMYFKSNFISSCSFCRFVFLFCLTRSFLSYFIMEAWFNFYLLVANPGIKLLEGKANETESEK